MCDIMILRKNGYTYFAKNSDREPGEAQLVVRIQPAVNDKSAKIKTTYLEINQTKDRFGVILSKPFWIWGAEMGANDQGVVIGNTAIFSKVQEKTNGLIGMDLLRLGLERGSSAKHALNEITNLLQKYGQGGVCGYYDKSLRYDNSFIIADANEAWVLEAVNRHWVAKKVDIFAATSNCMTIGTDFDLKSDGIEDFAKQRGLFSGKGDFDFTKAFDTRFIPFFARSKQRLATSISSLRKTYEAPEIKSADIMNILRCHQSFSTSHYARTNSDTCMHMAGYIRRSQTCGSMVSFINATKSTHFFTGTSAPCLSIFKPVNFNYLEEFCVLNKDEFTVKDSIWQRHEHIHRRIILNPNDRDELLKSRDDAENKIHACFDLQSYDKICFQWENHWYEHFRKKPFCYSPLSFYSQIWRRLNKVDSIE
ncbi:MAG: C69 family dipeptidase [Desulfobacterales bacterium]|nr:C69 family dipeptidase [Desulfobacterales bacterium]MBF0396838.1 C69 family dipeptidase [Desulfobacterales bacterium]